MIWFFIKILRWYAERFYYNPANQQSRRPGEPVGHLTQMLWASSTAVGCSRTQKLIKQPPNTYPKFQRSSYTVCHYYPQGNIIELMEENWRPLKKKYKSTYDIKTGRNMCGPFGAGQALDKYAKCGCKRRSTGKERIQINHINLENPRTISMKCLFKKGEMDKHHRLHDFFTLRADGARLKGHIILRSFDNKNRFD